MAEKYLHKVADAVPSDGKSLAKGPTYRNIVVKDGFPGLDDSTTCWEILVKAASKFPKSNAFGTRTIVNGEAGPYEFQNYETVFETSKAVGSALRFVGLQTSGRVGIYGANSPEWVLTMEGCNSQSIYCVPLYDTLGPDAIEFIVNHAEVSIVFVQSSKIKALSAVFEKISTLVKTVVSFDTWDADSRAKAEAQGIKAYDWLEFVELGRQNPAPLTPPSAEDICTIMYTSGTTGEPKGVLLTHRSIVSQIAGLKSYIEQIELIRLDHNDVYLSFLPLAHIFERSALEFNIFNGASVGFWRGDVKLLMDDIAELKPTYFTGVPRIYDRMYSGIKAKAAESAVKGLLFNFFYGRKVRALRAGKPHNQAGPIADRIVFGKVKSKLGGRVKFIVSGAAPLAPHVEEFLKVTMCAPVLQGYGLTESCAGGFLSLPDLPAMAGTVGPPLGCVDVRLESVPEMGYDALGTTEGVQPRGEICLKGPCLFSGYHKREDLTKEAIDSDGWFHTGDVGEWQVSGAMKIIDRKKNIFKLAQGEYVAVEVLENVYGNSPIVDSVWVYGNSFEATLVAVAVPNEAALLAWAKANSVQGTFQELVQSDAAKAFVLKELVTVGKAGKLRGFELLKAVHLDAVPFDMDRDLLTPTFKKKRPQLLKYYRKEIDALYAKLKAEEEAKGK